MLSPSFFSILQNYINITKVNCQEKLSTFFIYGTIFYTETLCSFFEEPTNSFIELLLVKVLAVKVQL